MNLLTMCGSSEKLVDIQGTECENNGVSFLIVMYMWCLIVRKIDVFI